MALSSILQNQETIPEFPDRVPSSQGCGFPELNSARTYFQAKPESPKLPMLKATL